MEPIQLQQVVMRVADTLRPLAESKGLELGITVIKPNMVIQTDERILTQILINLANNAIKFTDKGSVNIEMDQHQVNGDLRSEIRVVDTGVGIRPEDEADIFQAFIQLDDSVRRRQEGSGLGLHLTRKLAELIGGGISLQSQYGKGSTFALVWPKSSNDAP